MSEEIWNQMREEVRRINEEFAHKFPKNTALTCVKPSERHEPLMLLGTVSSGIHPTNHTPYYVRRMKITPVKEVNDNEKETC